MSLVKYIQYIPIITTLFTYPNTSSLYTQKEMLWNTLASKNIRWVQSECVTAIKLLSFYTQLCVLKLKGVILNQDMQFERQEICLLVLVLRRIERRRRRNMAEKMIFLFFCFFLLGGFGRTLRTPLATGLRIGSRS